MAAILISAGRLVPVLTSSYMVERGHLAVAQVGGEIRVVDAVRDGRLVAAAGEHELALLALHDRGARVLAHRQHTARSDRRVLQQVEGDEAVVGADASGSSRMLRQLLRGGRAAGSGRCRASPPPSGGGSATGVDLEERALRRLEGRHPLGRDQSIGRRVGTERQELRVLEVIHDVNIGLRLRARRLRRLRRPPAWPRRHHCETGSAPFTRAGWRRTSGGSD